MELPCLWFKMGLSDTVQLDAPYDVAHEFQLNSKGVHLNGIYCSIGANGLVGVPAGDLQTWCRNENPEGPDGSTKELAIVVDGEPEHGSYVMHFHSWSSQRTFDAADSTKKAHLQGLITKVWPSWRSVKALVEESDKSQLMFKSYHLWFNGAIIKDQRTYEAMRWLPGQQDRKWEFHVVNQSVLFSDIDKEDGLYLAGVKGDITWTDKLVVSRSLNDSDMLPEAIRQCTSWTTVRDVMQYLGNEMACRAFLFNRQSWPGSMAMADKLASISAVLQAAASIVDGVTVVAQRPIEGTNTHGCVGWAVVYKSYNIIVIEVEKDASDSAQVEQLAAQMVAATEDSVHKCGVKLRHEAQEVARKLPAFGIISDGDDYKPYKIFTDSNGVRRMVTMYNEIDARVWPGEDHKRAQVMLRPVVQLLTSMMQQQIKEYDELNAHRDKVCRTAS